MNSFMGWMIRHYSYREMGVCIMLILLGLCGSIINRRFYTPVVTAESSIQPIAINQASIETLEKLPFISRKRAGLIIEWRHHHGPIQNAQVLQSQLHLSGKQIQILERLIQY
ncbi:MAG: helix-hairpin-helix domain-containing protein [Candidatus Delongbacteria bacterium]|nr:helix-hairpin-helix domain-containing protein [Candidatus Delongbacteria bacterium]